MMYRTRGTPRRRHRTHNERSSLAARRSITARMVPMEERRHEHHATGAPCLAQPVRPSGYCYWHDPAIATERDAARRQGGYNKSNRSRAAKTMALTSDDLLLTLSRAILKVEAGTLEPGPANAMASLARAMTSIRETSDLEQRLAELEARVDAPMMRRSG